MATLLRWHATPGLLSAPDCSVLGVASVHVDRGIPARVTAASLGWLNELAQESPGTGS